MLFRESSSSDFGGVTVLGSKKTAIQQLTVTLHTGASQLVGPWSSGGGMGD